MEKGSRGKMADEQPVTTEQDSVRRLAEIRAREVITSHPIPLEVVGAVDVLCSMIDSLTAERDEDQRVAGNLLARIFRDGGHRAATYETLGEAAAVADLEVANLFARAEAAEAEVKRLREALELIGGGESLDANGCARVARAALATPPSEGGQPNGHS